MCTYLVAAAQIHSLSLTEATWRSDRGKESAARCILAARQGNEEAFAVTWSNLKPVMLYSQVEEATLHCGDEERDELLYYILAAHPGRTLVFANAVSTARRIAALLHILKLPSAALHAGTCRPPAVLCCTRGTPPCRRRQGAEDGFSYLPTRAC